ncbi:hypothetical protein BAE44_0008812, partial [Dichanthelium oligosanthes]
LRAGVTGAAQLRGRGPLRPRQVSLPRRRPPRLHRPEGAAAEFSSTLPKANCISSRFSFKLFWKTIFGHIPENVFKNCNVREGQALCVGWNAYNLWPIWEGRIGIGIVRI